MHIYTIYTQIYELKCTIKHTTIAYVSKLLNLLLFFKYNFFLSWYNIKNGYKKS